MPSWTIIHFHLFSPQTLWLKAKQQKFDLSNVKAEISKREDGQLKSYF